MHAAPAQPLNIPCARQPAVVSSVRTGARTLRLDRGAGRTRTGRQDKPPLAAAALPPLPALSTLFRANARSWPDTDGLDKATTSLPSPVYSAAVRSAPEHETKRYAGR